ncbi:alpha/beta fold hydrolase [Psychrobacter sp. M13]|uniref:alpha/beta fold hydrolase n=1 Tax=Psychrobacter sp. M13 TaxID=3067275 RepID=UPI0019199311|nr:alpha/beta hydrolase [Psychrobacter sp. M13]WLP94651.1 alpha/beta hydrolase [Psychrobacter sp. M13]
MIEDFAKSITLDNKRARYYELSELNSSVNKETDDKNCERVKAHFYGGNGFTVGNYQPLLIELAAGFELSSLAMRGYWHDKPTAQVLTREQDADMLIKFLEQTQDAPIIAIGHSQGATATAIAAAKRPDLFSQLYLIEPVTFTKSQAILYKLIPRAIKLKRQPFKSALEKQTIWSSVDELYESLRANKAYRRVSDEHLYLFAKESLVQQSDGSYTFIFSPEQEIANYFGIPYIDGALKKLKKMNLSYQLIVGKPTIFISDKVRNNWRKFVPASQLTTLPENGHLLPIEAPKVCADTILALHKAANS